MPRNSAGAYTLPSAVNPVVIDTEITTNWANTTLEDIKTGITDSLDRSGRGNMLAPLRATDGTPSAPSLSFTNAATYGLYVNGSGHASVAAGGVEVMEFRPTVTYVKIGIDLSGLKITNSGAPTTDSDLVTKVYADSLAFSSALPTQTGNAGKVPRTNGTTAAWADWWGSAVALTTTATLTVRTLYHADSTSASFTATLPPSPTVGDWVWVVDKTGKCADNPITLGRNSTNIRGAAENLIMDVPYDSVLLIYTSAGWVEQ